MTIEDLRYKIQNLKRVRILPRINPFNRDKLKTTFKKHTKNRFKKIVS